jgi:predicted KAP-like P-loop ATPase
MITVKMADKTQTTEQRRQVAKEHTLFSSDRPIAGRAEDKLGRRGFAEAIASAVQGWRKQESLVIGIHGSWGTGKSSIKNMAVEALREQRQDSTVVEFNPWQFANREQLTQAFFDQVGAALGRGDVGTHKDRRKLMNRWRRYAAYLSGASGLAHAVRKPFLIFAAVMGLVIFGSASLGIRWLSVACGILLVVLPSALIVSSRLSQAIAEILEATVAGISLEDSKTEIAKHLSKLKGPVLIVVDDVDRLNPAEQVEVLQLIKANGDFPNLIYLVLCDRMTVERSVDTTLGCSGREYVEKIVQVNFDVPAVERTRLTDALFQGLDLILREEKVKERFDENRFRNLFFASLDQYFETLRDVNRFLSTLSFHFGIFRGQGAFEVNPVDLIALEVLRFFEPEVYRSLPTSKRVLTQSRASSASSADADRRALSAIIDMAPESTRERVRETIKQLFPPAEWGVGGKTYDPDFESSWFRELRVCSRLVFDRYFHFCVPLGDISHSRLERLLGATGDRIALREELRALEVQQLLPEALTRLRAYDGQIPLTHAQQFITAIFDVGECIPGEAVASLGTPVALRVIGMIHRFLKRDENPDRRLQSLREAIRLTEGLSLPVWFVAVEQPPSDTARAPNDRILPAEGLDELKRLCVDKIRSSSKDGRLASNPSLAMIMFRWRDWAGPEEPNAFASALVQRPGGAVQLLRGFALPVTVYGFDQSLPQESWQIRLSDVEHFVPIASVEDALKGIPPDSLGSQEIRAVEAFRRALQRRREGKSDEDLLSV